MKEIKFYAITLVLLIFSLLLNEVPAMGQQLSGNGKVVTQERNVSGFKGINVGGGFTVEITQGNKEGVRLEAEENLMGNITTEVRDGVLYLHSKGSISTSKGLKAYITIKELERLDVSGGVKVTGKSTFKTNTLTMGMSGGSKVTLAMDVKNLKAELSGACKADLTGRADAVMLGMSGASKMEAQSLEAKRVKVEASGASKVNVFAKESLNIDASSASVVAYKGSPSITAETSAAARVLKL